MSGAQQDIRRKKQALDYATRLRHRVIWRIPALWLVKTSSGRALLFESLSRRSPISRSSSILNPTTT